MYQKNGLISIIVSMLITTCSLAYGRSDILIEDFEHNDFGNWIVEGDAFGTGPSEGNYANQWPLWGYKGKRLANSFAYGDGKTGQLTSPEFSIQRRYINFLVGGGKHPERTCVELLINGKVVRSSTGSNGDNYVPLFWSTWDVSEFTGQTARIRLADRETGGWGHILADHIFQSDISETNNNQFVNPTYHFEAIGGSSFGDPHPFYDNESQKWHLFYQGSAGDWQHAQSKDMINYEHLPLAMTPSLDKGETSLFSGCVCLDKNGWPLIIYTSVGYGRAPREYTEVWGARGDDGFVRWGGFNKSNDKKIDDLLIRWRKLSENPLFTSDRNKPFIWDFRDPYVFYAGQEAFMILGGHVSENYDVGAIGIYHALNNELTKWEQAGILLEDHEPSGNLECPFMFEQNGKWCLGFSTFRGSEYITGSFDPKTAKLIPQYRGYLESNRQYMYAPSIATTDKGRTILWGSLPGDYSWATLPRELTIAGTGRLLQNPAKELKSLRKDSGVSGSNLIVKNQSGKRIGTQGDQIEVILEFKDINADRYGLKVLCSPDGQRGFDISCDKDKLAMYNGNVTVNYDLLDIKAVNKLHVFVDKSIVEVYVNGGQACFTMVTRYNPDTDNGVEVFAENGQVKVSNFNIYELSR